MQVLFSARNASVGLGPTFYALGQACLAHSTQPTPCCLQIGHHCSCRTSADWFTVRLRGFTLDKFHCPRCGILIFLLRMPWCSSGAFPSAPDLPACWWLLSSSDLLVWLDGLLEGSYLHFGHVMASSDNGQLLNGVQGKFLVLSAATETSPTSLAHHQPMGGTDVVLSLNEWRPLPTQQCRSR